MNHIRSKESESFREIDLLRIYNQLRHNFGLIILCTVLAAGVAFVVSKFQTPIFQASTQVMVTRSSSSNSPVSDVTQQLNTQQLTETYVELLQQEWARNDIAARLGGTVTAGQIDVSAATNTLILNILAEDADPERAKQIANALVDVLVAQNEAVQASRYTDAEQGLELQIQQIQVQLAEVQSQLDLAKTTALDDQIAQVEERIKSTQESKDAALADLARLRLPEMDDVPALIVSDQARLEENKTLLASQLAELDVLNNKLINDPLVLNDPKLADDIKVQIADKESAISLVRNEILALEEDIVWLTPLAEAGVVEKMRKEKQDFAALQTTLLASYQNTYTNLIVSGETSKLGTDKVTKLEKDLSLYQQIYLNLMNNRETVRLQKMQNMPSVIQIKPAIVGKQPVRPKTTVNTTFGGFAGLLLSVVAVLLIDFLDTTLKKREDIERALDMPVIGYVPQLIKADNEHPGPYVETVPRSPAAEAFRLLRANLEFMGVDQPLKSILVASPGASEGKTTIAVNLAAVIAQSGKRVVVVDADLRRPRVHREMGMSNRFGLSDVFREKAALQDVYQASGNPNLTIITSGGLPPNPAELLGSDKMRQILEQLEAEFDVVIIDSTPTIVADSQLIAARADGVLLVLWPGHTHAEPAYATVEQYRRAGAHLLGIVLNQVQTDTNYGYSQTHYYEYSQYNTDEAKGKNGRKLKLPWMNQSLAQKNDRVVK